MIHKLVQCSTTDPKVVGSNPGLASQPTLAQVIIERNFNREVVNFEIKQQYD